MIVGVVKETEGGERRVALDPDSVARLTKKGVEVHVQSGAGDGAFHGDTAYEAAGATVVPDAISVWQHSDVILKVNPPTSGEVGLLRSQAIIIGFLNPLRDPERIQRIADRGASAFSMEMIPRISPAGRPAIHDPKREGRVTASAAPTIVEIVVRTPLMVKR